MNVHEHPFELADILPLAKNEFLYKPVGLVDGYP
jgi:hypothetical protein